MPSQVFPINSDNPWEGAILVDPLLIEGGGVAYLRVLQYFPNAMRMRLAPDAVSDDNLPGPYFTPAVEQYLRAFTFVSPVDYQPFGSPPFNSVTIPGPNYPGNSFTDDTEPYFWTEPGDGSTNAVNELWSNVGLISLTIDDGMVQVEADAAFEIRAGLPTVTVTAEAVVVIVDAAFEIRAGSPAVVVTAEAVVVPVRDAAFEIRAGSPVVTVTADTTLPPSVDVAFVIRAGQPTVSVMADVVDPPDTDVAFVIRAGLPTVSVSVDVIRPLPVTTPALVTHVLATVGPYPDGSTRYLWDGSGPLPYGGHVYDGTDGAITVSSAPSGVDGTDSRMTVLIPLVSAAARAAALGNYGPVPVEILWIVSTDGGMTFTPTPRTFVGRVSGPKINGDVLSLEIETWLGDADRSFVRNWSDEDQQRRFPGDRGFEFARSLSEGIESSWPP